MTGKKAQFTHSVNAKCSRMEQFAYKFLRIFRGDTVTVLVLKPVDIIDYTRDVLSGKSGPICTLHEHGHWLYRLLTPRT